LVDRHLGCARIDEERSENQENRSKCATKY